jgi:hypothetical protein
MFDYERVWQCGCGCFLNDFSCQNACKWFFLFFKNYFWHQHIKTIQNIQTILNFSKKQNSNFLGTQPQLRSQTCSMWIGNWGSISSSTLTYVSTLCPLSLFSKVLM